MQSRYLFCAAVSLLIVLSGCGGGGSSTPQSTTTTTTGTTSSSATPDFSLAIAPLAVTVTPGGAAQTVAIAASALNGFTGNVNVSVGALPKGINVSPMTITLAAGALQQLTLVADASASVGSANISLQGSSGALTHVVSAAVTVTQTPSVPTASLSDSAFSFGDNLVGNTLTQAVVTVTNNGMVVLTMAPSLSGDSGFALTSAGSCGSQLQPGASCPVLVSYKPTSPSAPATQNALLSLGFGGVAAGTAETVALSGTSTTLLAGQVTATDNPQVALYTLTIPFDGTVTVRFGKDTNYGMKTWSVSAPAGGGPVSIFVAGMQGKTTYHMQAEVTFANGISASDGDHTFTTQAVPSSMQPVLTATTTAGMTPQPGIEMLNLLNGTPSGIVVTDLTGNVLWTYATPGLASNYIQGVKLLPNGDLLMAIGPNSTVPLSYVPSATISEIREVNLAGDTVREITLNDINSLLASATCAECNVTLQSLHHDVEPLPNGHWLLLGNVTMALSDTTTPVLYNSPVTNVLGDVIIDLDQNLRPVWAWSSFNHLNPNYHPYQWPDWTHANAVLYSPDDGNIILSVRNKNFVMKLDYENGKGSGAVLWRLGSGGNLTLKNGIDPTDWQYAQHYPSFFSSNTSGVFSLGLMDNGNDRTFANNINCGTPNNPPCEYTTVPVFQIDENALTATVTFRQVLPASQYSYFGGSTDLLANANIEYDLCAEGNGSYIYEVTPQSTPQTVWSMHVTGTYAYRGLRMPSLYPGVQW